MGQATAGPTSVGGAPLSSVSEIGFSTSGASGAAAGVASMASLSLTAMGDVAKGDATQASDDFQADRATRAAEFGEVQATLTDTTMRQNLNTTLGNIVSIRAAANIDPTSPTTAALMDQSSSRSDSQRMAAVGSINAQDAEDLASADYLRKAGDFAVTQSHIQAGADITGGIAKGVAAAAPFALALL